MSLYTRVQKLKNAPSEPSQASTEKSPHNLYINKKNKLRDWQEPIRVRLFCYYFPFKPSVVVLLARSQMRTSRAIGLLLPVGTIDIYRLTSANPSPRAVSPTALAECAELARSSNSDAAALAVSDPGTGRAIGLLWPVGTIDIYRLTSANRPRGVCGAGPEQQ
jgi:hypothetical protein